MNNNKKFTYIYLGLVLIRLIITLNSFGFIHPDEFFQNSEITSNLIFNYSNDFVPGSSELPFKSWEWNNNKPFRSLLPVLNSTGIGFWLLKKFIGDSPSAYSLFITQRLCMFFMSLLIDLSLWNISQSTTSLLIYASSPVVFTFLQRPFSNSIETLLLALAILSYTRAIRLNSSISKFWSTLLGSLVAVGVFTRVTFLAFVLPLILGTVTSAAKVASRRPTNLEKVISLIQQGIPITISLVLTSLALISVDSYYFSGGKLFSDFVVTPLNSLLFNVSTENLKDHGIHPRWLHFLVNAPMLFGIAFLGIVWKGLQLWKEEGLKENETGRNRLYLALVFIPTFILSIFPHQEPRFLLPSIVPISLLVPQISIFKSNTSTSIGYRRIFWILWIVHATLFTILFGFLHQGGLIPVLLKLNQELSIPGLPFLSTLNGFETEMIKIDTVEFVFWKTFMPPRHLLLPIPTSANTTPIIHLQDVSGSSSSILFSTLQTLSLSTSTSTAIILVAPSYSFDHLVLPENCTKELFTKGIHVDMDRLDEMAGVGWERWGISALRIARGCQWLLD